MNKRSTFVEKFAVVNLLFKISTEYAKQFSNLNIVGTDAYIIVLKLFWLMKYRITYICWYIHKRIVNFVNPPCLVEWHCQWEWAIHFFQNHKGYVIEPFSPSEVSRSLLVWSMPDVLCISFLVPLPYFQPPSTKEVFLFAETNLHTVFVLIKRKI